MIKNSTGPILHGFGPTGPSQELIEAAEDFYAWVHADVPVRPTKGQIATAVGLTVAAAGGLALWALNRR